VLPYLDGSNTFSAAQTIGDGTASVGISLNGAAGAVRNFVIHTSSTPRWVIRGDASAESGANAGTDLQILNRADNGTQISVAAAIRRSDGSVVIGSPSGSFKGAGSLNAQAVYDDNVLLTCYAIEAELTGKVTKARWDDSALNRELPQPDGKIQVEVTTHKPAARFTARAAELLNPKSYGQSWKTTGHLPAMPSPAEWDASGKKMGVGDIVQRLWETVECQAIHIDKLLARIEALEAKLS
jgi:hypothetical protein